MTKSHSLTAKVEIGLFQNIVCVCVFVGRGGGGAGVHSVLNGLIEMMLNTNGI